MADPAPDNLPQTTGISEDDRRDILAQIERVSQENRLHAGPEVFAIHPRKKELLVPLAVNLGALAVLVLGLGALYFLFRQGADDLAQNQVVLQSTEGKLIEELKKQSESQLLAKDQQIADIQKRLESVAQQKNALQSTMAERIAAREAELHQQLKDALEAERARLTAAGYSQAVVEEKLKEFERKKTVEFQKQLDAFKAKAETERQALESNLKKQQDDFQRNLSDLAGERQKILEDAKSRQRELESQLEQKNRDLQAQKSASQAQLASAQQQLADLNESRAKVDSVQNQLMGLYTKISQSIQARQYVEALKQVQSLTVYLNDPSLRAFAEIQKRRDADLLMAAALSDWLVQDQKRLEADNARVQLTQSDLELIQTLVQQANQSAATGKKDEASKLYQQALSKVPAVLEAHQYFLDQALAAERTRQKAFADALEAGNAALLTGKALDARVAYQAALEALPATAEQRQEYATQWQKAVYDSEFLDRQGKLDDGFKKDLAAAQALLKSKQPASALTAFVSIVARYPVGQAGFASLAGIRQAASRLQEPSPREAALESELAQLRSDLAGVRSEGDPLATTSPDATSLEAMKSRFQDFLSKDKPLWAKAPTSAQVLQSKLLLNGFLGSEEMATAFPGLVDKVARYEKTSIEAGQKEGLANVNDAVANLGQLTTKEERKQYLSTLQKRFAANAALSEVFTRLSKLF